MQRMEAPETEQSRHSEAPDAGGAVPTWSGESFTHGRSRS